MTDERLFAYEQLERLAKQAWDMRKHYLDENNDENMRYKAAVIEEGLYECIIGYAHALADDIEGKLNEPFAVS